MIHVIDRVMFPLPIEPITGLVAKDPMLKTLLTAVKAAGLVGTLSGTIRLKRLIKFSYSIFYEFSVASKTHYFFSL